MFELQAVFYICGIIMMLMAIFLAGFYFGWGSRIAYVKAKADVESSESSQSSLPYLASGGGSTPARSGLN